MTDSSIPCLSYSDFVASLHRKTGGKRLPYAGTIEVTPHCNMRCAHCYVSHCDWPEGVLSRGELFRILDEVAQEGCLWLLLTGGEPFSRDDFLDIYTHAKKNGMMVSIFTNGTLITPEIARYLHHWSPRLVEVSIYGATKETHEGITGVPGSFERCLTGVRLLVEQGVRLTLKTMVMSLNRHEIWEMKRLAESFSIPFRFDAILNPALDMSRHPCGLRVPPEEVVRLDVEDPDYYSEWRDCVQAFSKLPPPGDRLFTCGAGMARFHIDAFGRLQMCTIVREPSYDLRQGSFREGWRDFLPAILERKTAGISPCRSCEYRPVCLVCPGWSQLEYGTLEERPVEYLCQIARLRAEAFGLETRASGARQSALSQPSGERITQIGNSLQTGACT